MKSISIQGKFRDKFGKVSGKNYRKQGLVPGVIYGGEKEIHFVADQKDLKLLVYTPNFLKAEMTIEGKNYICIVKDLQFHKVTDSLIHIDLLELVNQKKVKADIPVKLIGNAEGVKAGGRLLFKLKKLKVATTPEYLRESIEVDITKLGVGPNIRIEDIKVEGINILNSPKVPVVGVVVTRVLKQEAASGVSSTTTAKTASAPATAKDKK